MTTDAPDMNTTDDEVSAPAEDAAVPAPLDRLTRLLAIGTAIGLIAVLSATAFLVYSATQGQRAPRTAAERVLFRLEAEVEAYPETPAAWTEYARALIAADQLSQAEGVLNDAEEFIGEQPYFDVEYARLMFVRGEFEGSIELLEAAIVEIFGVREAELAMLDERGITMTNSSVDDDLVVAHLLLAEIQADSQNAQGQIDALDVALEFSPEMADITVVRGDAHASLGNKAEAKADYEYALELIPDYEPALAGLAAIGE